ncbi:MAG: hypothetical protein E6Q37_06360 [Crocinitomicaceae bacterium]|nr:MAG: hypothetical protein E6Q37_06360 [Crocinitomicaceae bacterium]
MTEDFSLLVKRKRRNLKFPKHDLKKRNLAKCKLSEHDERFLIVDEAQAQEFGVSEARSQKT